MTLSTLSKGVLGALTIATAFATTSPASADYYYRRHGWNPGAAVAVGALGGLALGAALAAPRPAYGYGYGYGYGYPAPVYAPRPVYVEPAPRCWIQRHRVWVPGWGYEIRRERVCDY